MTAHKLLEEALEQIDKLSDAEFSALTAEIIAESSVIQDNNQPITSSLIIAQSYNRKLLTTLYSCLSEGVAANDANLAEAA